MSLAAVPKIYSGLSKAGSLLTNKYVATAFIGVEGYHIAEEIWEDKHGDDVGLSGAFGLEWEDLVPLLLAFGGPMAKVAINANSFRKSGFLRTASQLPRVSGLGKIFARGHKTDQASSFASTMFRKEKRIVVGGSSGTALISLSGKGLDFHKRSSKLFNVRTVGGTAVGAGLITAFSDSEFLVEAVNYLEMIASVLFPEEAIVTKEYEIDDGIWALSDPDHFIAVVMQQFPQLSSVDARVHLFQTIERAKSIANGMSKFNEIRGDTETVVFEDADVAKVLLSEEDRRIEIDAKRESLQPADPTNTDERTGAAISSFKV